MDRYGPQGSEILKVTGQELLKMFFTDGTLPLGNSGIAFDAARIDVAVFV